MNERTVVHVVRHGEVENPERILYGRLPGYRLSVRGEAMADAVAAHFAERQARGDVDIAAVVSSPLERARQTAAPIATALGVDVSTDDRLIESENVFQGQKVSVGDGALSDPRYWKHLWNPLRPSWGEPYRHIADRMLAAVSDARDSHPGRDVVCVSHQLPTWTARRAAERRRLWHDPRRRECALASVTSFVFVDRRFVGIDYCDPAAGL